MEGLRRFRSHAAFALTRPTTDGGAHAKAGRFSGDCSDPGLFPSGARMDFAAHKRVPAGDVNRIQDALLKLGEDASPAGQIGVDGFVRPDPAFLGNLEKIDFWSVTLAKAFVRSWQSASGLVGGRPFRILACRSRGVLARGIHSCSAAGAAIRLRTTERTRQKTMPARQAKNA